MRALAASTLGADRVLVTHLPNVRYLSGFSGSNAVLVLGPDADADLIGTDGRYVDQVAQEAPDLPTLIDRDTLAAVVSRVARSDVTTAVESSLPLGDLPVVRDRVGEPIVAAGLVEQVRAVKDRDEIEDLAAACAITVEALAILSGEMRVGVTEVALARRLEQLFGELGAEDRAFDTIVGSGPHSAIPHHQPGRRALRAGDLVVVDCGARVNGYHADMTRTFVVAAEPEDVAARPARRGPRGAAGGHGRLRGWDPRPRDRRRGPRSAGPGGPGGPVHPRPGPWRGARDP